MLAAAASQPACGIWPRGPNYVAYNRRPFAVHSVVFAPDSRTVLVAGNDGLAHRYDVDYQETVQYLRNRLQRDFSAEEQTQYDLNGDLITCQYLDSE